LMEIWEHGGAEVRSRCFGFVGLLGHVGG
jgi:hypothetical protein